MHSFIASELQRQGVRFHQDDNAFLWVSDPKALQAAGDRLSPEIIANAWTLGPWFWGQVLQERPGRRQLAAVKLSNSIGT